MKATPSGDREDREMLLMLMVGAAGAEDASACPWPRGVELKTQVDGDEVLIESAVYPVKARADWESLAELLRECEMAPTARTLQQWRSARSKARGMAYSVILSPIALVAGPYAGTLREDLVASIKAGRPELPPPETVCREFGWPSVVTWTTGEQLFAGELARAEAELREPVHSRLGWLVVAGNLSEEREDVEPDRYTLIVRDATARELLRQQGQGPMSDGFSAGQPMSPEHLEDGWAAGIAGGSIEEGEMPMRVYLVDTATNRRCEWTVMEEGAEVSIELADPTEASPAPRPDPAPVPVPVPSAGGLVCNDGAISPSCSTCEPGCCSSHDGCK